LIILFNSNLSLNSLPWKRNVMNKMPRQITSPKLLKGEGISNKETSYFEITQ